MGSVKTGMLSLTEELLEKLVRKDSIHDTYDVEDNPFARGKFATVRKCRHKVTGLEYAAKFVRKRRRATDHHYEILHEVGVLNLCSPCVRVVSLHEVYETRSEMALILELAEGGDLQEVLDAEEDIIEEEVVRLMRDVLEGVSFLHSRNLAHLDLKPQNLVLMGKFPGCDIKLCDFGISRVVEDGVEVREIMGTPDYIAPEIVNYEPISRATDIWSLGVLAYVLLTGCTPFGGETKQETFCNITRAQIDFPDELFHDVSPQARDFISRLLRAKPSERLSAQQCLDHPWLTRCSAHPAPAPMTSTCDDHCDNDADIPSSSLEDTFTYRNSDILTNSEETLVNFVDDSDATVHSDEQIVSTTPLADPPTPTLPSSDNASDRSSGIFSDCSVEFSSDSASDGSSVTSWEDGCDLSQEVRCSSPTSKINLHPHFDKSICERCDELQRAMGQKKGVEQDLFKPWEKLCRGSVSMGQEKFTKSGSDQGSPQLSPPCFKSSSKNLGKTVQRSLHMLEVRSNSRKVISSRFPVKDGNHSVAPRVRALQSKFAT